LKSKIQLTKHILVPKHILLSEQKKKEVIKKYGIKKLSQFPRILKTDPIVKILGAKEGDLIKIIRNENSGKESIYYRVVIEV
jgi:DNA-directed RNA polymerase subunit H (RpoH/RPB5)